MAGAALLVAASAALRARIAGPAAAALQRGVELGAAGADNASSEASSAEAAPAKATAR